SLERAVALAPGSIPAREELADVYDSIDRHGDALVQLQLLAGLDRSHVERQVALGLAQAKAHRWELAVLTLNGALERASDKTPIDAALGRVWLEGAQAHRDRAGLSKAVDALARIVSSPGATSETLGLYGRALLEEGNTERAEETLHDAVNRYPLDPNALLQYSIAAEKQNHLGVARTALLQYGALVANDPD